MASKSGRGVLAFFAKPTRSNDEDVLDTILAVMSLDVTREETASHKVNPIGNKAQVIGPGATNPTTSPAAINAADRPASVLNNLSFTSIGPVIFSRYRPRLGLPTDR
jgi:hypothetical protein